MSASKSQSANQPAHKVVSREEWLAARKELLVAEKELTRRSDEIAQRRTELPWVKIEKRYQFETDEGAASLADLFRGRSQILMYHFMFGPDYTAGCPACSTIADCFNGFAVHLANHDVRWSVSVIQRSHGGHRFQPFNARHFTTPDSQLLKSKQLSLRNLNRFDAIGGFEAGVAHLGGHGIGLERL